MPWEACGGGAMLRNRSKTLSPKRKMLVRVTLQACAFSHSLANVKWWRRPPRCFFAKCSGSVGLGSSRTVPVVLPLLPKLQLPPPRLRAQRVFRRPPRRCPRLGCRACLTCIARLTCCARLTCVACRTRLACLTRLAPLSRFLELLRRCMHVVAVSDACPL